MKTLNYSAARQQITHAMNTVVEDHAPLLITRANLGSVPLEYRPDPGQPEPVDYMPSKVPGEKGQTCGTNDARIEGIEKKVTFRCCIDWRKRRCSGPKRVDRQGHRESSFDA